MIFLRRLSSSLATSSIPHLTSRDLMKHGFSIFDLDGKMLELFDKIHELYGDTYSFRVLPIGPKCFVLHNPDDAEVLYRASGKWPIRLGFSALEGYRSKRELYSNSKGLIASMGQDWHDFRTQVQTALLKPKLIQAYHQRVDGVAKDFVDNIFEHSLEEDGSASSDMIEYLYQWALESTGVLAFDKRLGVINPSISLDSEAQEIINLVQKLFVLVHKLELNPIWKVIGVLQPKYKEAMRLFERLEELAMKYTDEKIAHMTEHSKLEEEEGSSSVIEALYKSGCAQNILYTLAVDMLMAGVDTTSSQISFALYYIAKHPVVQERLYHEIRGLDITDPGFVGKAVYLNGCLKEVLRLRPTAFGNNRVIEHNVDLNGFTIEKGSIITFYHMAMSNDPRFVKDPDKFIPERFIRGNPQYEKMHPFLMLPFGHGPRVCVGKRFAHMEMCLLLARIVSKYRLSSTPEPLRVKIPILMKPDGAIPVRFVPRDQ